jgi:hypothetical protein
MKTAIGLMMRKVPKTKVVSGRLTQMAKSIMRTLQALKTEKGLIKMATSSWRFEMQTAT